MRNLVKYMLVPALALTAACGRDDNAKIDDALQSDLALASSMQPYQAQPFVSPMEQGYAGYNGYAPQPQQYNAGYYNPAPRPATTVRRASTSSGTYSRPAPAPTRVVKHTKRDAIIGAAAGAAIGAVTSSDKLKGAVIGAAAGGLLGAVIGNNVDKKRIPF